MAWVNGMSRVCTRSRLRTYTAPASGVGTDGTKTVNRPSSSSSMMNAGTSASSISTSAGFHASSLTVPRQSLCQTAQQGVPGKPLEEHLLHALANRAPRSSPHSDADEETEPQHQDQRQEALGRNPVRQQRCEWPHQIRDRLHALEQQQYRQVDGHDDEQAADERARDEFACVFHLGLPLGLFFTRPGAPCGARHKTAPRTPSPPRDVVCQNWRPRIMPVFACTVSREASHIRSDGAALRNPVTLASG